MAATISFIIAITGDGEDGIAAYVEPFVILLILVLNALVAIYQDNDAESALEALKNRYNPEIAKAVSKHEPASVATLKINGKKSTFFSLFSTHPPIDERIARLKEMPSL